MVKVKFLDQEYTLTDLVWTGPDQEIVEFLQALTNPNDLSGADPDPDLAIANKLAENMPDLKVLSFTEQPFDPEKVY